MSDEQLREMAAEAVEMHASSALPPLPLHRLEAELQELLALREDAEAEGALPHELAAIDQRIEQYMIAEIKKVDRIAESIRAQENSARECEVEAERLSAMAKRHRSRLKRIKDAALWAMQSLGVKSLSTPTNKLAVRGNGGVAPLDVYDLNAVPAQYKTATVKMPLEMWYQFRQLVAGDLLPMTDVSIDQVQVREALSVLVTCPECTDPATGNCIITERPCPRCEGKRLVRSTVPGVRLLLRGSHLRAE